MDKKKELRGKICKIISAMLDNPDKYGIYPTTKCYDQLENLIKDLLKTIAKEMRIKGKDIDFNMFTPLGIDEINDFVKQQNKKLSKLLKDHGVKQ